MSATLGFNEDHQVTVNPRRDHNDQRWFHLSCPCGWEGRTGTAAGAGLLAAGHARTGR